MKDVRLNDWSSGNKAFAVTKEMIMADMKSKKSEHESEVEDKLAAIRGKIRSLAGRMLLTKDVNQFIHDACILVDDLELTLRGK